ncbi:MAG TPA: glycosyltransferase family 2 protein [Acidimicrobiales bacterium]|nr:glycosyltransferase family 2 protein [Acidimicrobiales bacterium]
MTATCELSIVLPCLNEAETLATCIGKARASLARLGVAGEVVVADNGSTDGSQEIAAAAGARVVDVPERGYGAALRHGIDAAAGEFVIMADADDSYALDDLEPFLQALRGGADLVMGDRFKGGIEPGAMPALHRYLGNPVLSFVGRLFFRVPIHDFHCGMRGFRRDRIVGLGLRTTGMEFASEMVVRSAVAGLTIREVPTVLRPDGRSRAPHLRTWRDGWRHLRFLLAFSPRWLFFYPALVLVLGGTLAFGVLAFGSVSVGDLDFDVQTMTAAAAAIVVGLQAAGVALVSRAYASRLGLLPRSHRVEHLIDRFTLEWGLVVGALLGVGGAASFVVAVLRWRQTGFGDLATDDMRLPLAGMLLVVAGAQLMFVSFMLSLTRIGDVPAGADGAAGRPPGLHAAEPVAEPVAGDDPGDRPAPRAASHR